MKYYNDERKIHYETCAEEEQAEEEAAKKLREEEKIYRTAERKDKQTR